MRESQLTALFLGLLRSHNGYCPRGSTDIGLTTDGDMLLEFEKWTLFRVKMLRISQLFFEKSAKMTKFQPCQSYFLKLRDFGTRWHVPVPILPKSPPDIAITKRL